MKITLESILRKIRRAAISRSANPRPSSFPYISGDSFRALARHVMDERGSINPSAVCDGDTIFVRSDMIERFFAEVSPLIRARYKLITHNSDRNIGSPEINLADGKVMRWFAQNLIIDHPLVEAIPIGLENAHFSHAGRVALFEKIRMKKDAKRNGRILAAFSVSTNRKERESALKQLRNNCKADIIERTRGQKEYLKLLRQYSYVASPPGNGEDCHRTWEALYLGTTPLTKPAVCIEHFKRIGLPIATIDSWDSAPETLRTQTDIDERGLWMPYWKARIENV